VEIPEGALELRGGTLGHASAYVNGSYYLPWTDPTVNGSSVPSGDAESLGYSVKFNRSAASVGDLIQCAVHAERVGFRGYGMMLAEVSLPPGADVDRPSLDSAVSASGWDLQSYEVQRDRVVFYLRPRAGGTTFPFTFKPRFGITAQSSESVLYDYYNPEARASVPPARFKVEGTALPDEVKKISVHPEKARHPEVDFPKM
jgi:A-macroglobulin receptor binding domain